MKIMKNAKKKDIRKNEDNLKNIESPTNKKKTYKNKDILKNCR